MIFGTFAQDFYTCLWKISWSFNNICNRMILIICLKVEVPTLPCLFWMSAVFLFRSLQKSFLSSVKWNKSSFLFFQKIQYNQYCLEYFDWVLYFDSCVSKFCDLKESYLTDILNDLSKMYKHDDLLKMNNLANLIQRKSHLFFQIIWLWVKDITQWKLQTLTLLNLTHVNVHTFRCHFCS